MYPYVEVDYCYKVDDAELGSRCIRGFWCSDSATDFARRYRRLKTVRVRYSPENPAMSYIVDEDQDFR